MLTEKVKSGNLLTDKDAYIRYLEERLDAVANDFEVFNEKNQRFEEFEEKTNRLEQKVNILLSANNNPKYDELVDNIEVLNNKLVEYMNSNDSKIISHNTILCELTSNISSINERIKTKLDVSDFNKGLEDMKKYIDSEITQIEKNCIKIFDKLKKDLPEMCQDICNEQIKLFADSLNIQIRQMIDRSISESVPIIINSNFIKLISSYLKEPLSIVLYLYLYY